MMSMVQVSRSAMVYKPVLVCDLFNIWLLDYNVYQSLTHKQMFISEYLSLHGMCDRAEHALPFKSFRSIRFSNI